ncbi:MAG: hypothetical protein ACW96M_06755 [Candidatus Thorarchaeota archaeon]|jgi:hypothetical protein
MDVWISMERATGYVFLIVTLLLGSVLLITDFPGLFVPATSEKEIVLRSGFNDVSIDMTVDSQGNVIVVGGRMEGSETSTAKFHIVKVSSVGEEIWTKTWNNSLFNLLVSVEVDSLDEIIIAGVEGFNQENATGIVMKLSPDGVIEWEVEYAGLSYEWYSWPQEKHLFGLEIDSATDTIYVVGSLTDGNPRTLITSLDSSGSELWRTEWEGPSDSNGTDAAAFWLSSQEGLVVRCNIYGDDDTFYPYAGSCMASFALNGTLMWNRTVQEFYWTGIETGMNEYVTATDSWRGYNQVTRYSYDHEEISSFELIVGEYYSISIDGFVLNSTENIIGYGKVVSLIAGDSVTRDYSALFSGPQPPQTLVLSCSTSGDFQWYDFLVLGRMSEPCGARFDSDNRLIIAGHTSEWSFFENNIYVVFGFRQTPFPIPYQNLLVGFFPMLNIIIFALISEFEVLHTKGRSILSFRSPGWKPRTTVKQLLLVQTISLIFLLTYLVGFGSGGGPPPPIVYMPQWVSLLLLSLQFGILTLGLLFLIIRTRERNRARNIADDP